MGKKVDIILQKINEKLIATNDVEKLGELETKFCEYKELLFILNTKNMQHFIKYENNKIITTPVIDGEKLCDWNINRNIESWNSLSEIKDKYDIFSLMMELIDQHDKKRCHMKQYISVMHLFR